MADIKKKISMTRLQFQSIDEYNKWLLEFNKRYSGTGIVDSPIGSSTTLHPSYKHIQDGLNHNKELTIVTMVHGDKYLAAFRKNFDELLTIPIFYNNKLLIMYMDDKYKDNSNFTSKHPNVEYVKYESDKEFPNDRAKCLSAFIFGASRFVKTEYMLKWDCDTFKQETFDKVLINSNDYLNYSIWARDCFFTNSITELDSQTLNVFKPLYKGWKGRSDMVIGNNGKRLKRMQSFFCFYKMDFLKDVAQYLIDNHDGNMLIPSEDTTTSYFAFAWGKKTKYVKSNHIPTGYRK